MIPPIEACTKMGQLYDMDNRNLQYEVKSGEIIEHQTYDEVNIHIDTNDSTDIHR